MTEMVSTFKMVKGQIVTGKRQRFVETGKPGNFNTRAAKKEINSMLGQMKYEIEASQKQESFLTRDQHDRITGRVVSQQSSFPKFMREAGISSKSDFSKVLERKKGIRFDRIKKVAIERLNHGYRNDHGFDDPSTSFRVKTGQVYDNKDVIFRRIRGRIVPIRIKKSERHDLKEEAPF